jgi:hypothetical protein
MAASATATRLTKVRPSGPANPTEPTKPAGPFKGLTPVVRRGSATEQLVPPKKAQK